MKYTNYLLTYIIIVITVIIIIPEASDACKIFILNEDQNDVTLQPIELEKDKNIQFSGNNFITFVLPVSPGKSGSVIQLVHRRDITSVVCDGKNINVTISHPDGATRDYPQVKVDDLYQYSIRVNIVGGDGIKKVYRIENYQKIIEDDGPVFDMLGSFVPLNAGEYSITTETEIIEKKVYLTGKMSLTYEHPLLFVEGKIGEGKSGKFIVDFGAGGTVVGKNYLAKNAKITEVTSIMYSEKGEEVAPGTMGGVGGDVSGFLGNTRLKSLTFGEISFTDISVRVMEKLPDFNNKKIAGILGLDLLQKGKVVTLEYSPYSSNTTNMYFGEAILPESKVNSVPFSLAYGHIFIEGGINDVSLSFLFDTGARSIFIANSIATQANLDLNSEAIEVQGLDDKKTEAFKSITPKLHLGQNQFQDVPLIVSDLPVLKSMGMQDRGGLLGNSFLEKFRVVQIDFTNNIIHLWE